LDRGDTPRPIIARAPQATIADCIETFISAKESEGISLRRIKKLRFQLNHFEHFMSSRSKLFPSLITAKDLIEYRAGWETIWKSATTRQKAQQNIRGFLRTCCRENLNDLLAALKAIRLSKVDKARLEPKPFTEKEITALFNAIPKTFLAEKAAQASLLVKTMISTGLAIRDTLQLEKRSIRGAWLRINRQKTGRPVRQHLDSQLAQELLAAGDGEYVFWERRVHPLVTSAVTAWQDDLRDLMKNAGVWIKGNVSHRFRDTFVSDALARGWSLGDIADAIGDTLTITERHYKSLSDERQESRLAALPKRVWETHV
jgi:integrase